MFAASVDNLVMGTLLRREPFIPLEGVKMARSKMFVSSRKAQTELGYDPRPIEQALNDAVNYYRNVWRPVAARSGISDLRTKAV
jgi:dihydroflavonol-4-reductase